MTRYVIRRTNDTGAGVQLRADFTPEIALADDVQALVDHLDEKLTGGQMSGAAKTAITEAVSALDIDADETADDQRRRVQLAVLMTLGAGAFAAQN